MVALALNNKIVSGPIRPLFEGKAPIKAFGITIGTRKRQWIGEPVPSTTLLVLSQGRYDCSRSTFIGITQEEK